MTVFVIVGLLATFCCHRVVADYAPLGTAADRVESHVAAIKSGMQLMEEALKVLPYKQNITVEAYQTDSYTEKLKE